MNDENLQEIHNNGFTLIRGAVDSATVDALMRACQRALEVDDQVERARSSRGHVYAARNLLEVVPEIQTFWQQGILLDSLKLVLGDAIGLVRVLFFDKPPDRTWALPWHKDTAIAVKDNSGASTSFSRPTVKAGVPHVIACDDVLKQMLTLRLHLDEVTDENGPLRVIPGSHVSSESDGVGVENAVAIHAAAGDVLAMRPLITHSSGSSHPGTTRHRRILHLEFAACHELPDGYQWHDFVD
ncbi:Phytanoyl-CoA dioxygenase (PhyH) [Planctomycetes bacterium CA13]|uniref:Phytanoyl-CoA dioxygenase (PhyH) n=1 Tax=Novipirellula herctigrandis TaxID=2527986 RepID=A0A5C5ZDG8_9BACT|nr:Phytanoyl-CoA dioxygenase (PhyH) [Planctomycetes bacterium CA13]